MILERGDMWSVFDKSDHFCITTNSYIRKDGALVMGRGIAKEAAQRIPGIEFRAGRQVKLECGHLGVYQPIYCDPIVLFQVKRHFSSPASIDLIRLSCAALSVWASAHTNDRFDLNFPGVGNGKLRREDVLPIINTLPDNVHVWEYGTPQF